MILANLPCAVAAACNGPPIKSSIGSDENCPATFAITFSPNYPYLDEIYDLASTHPDYGSPNGIAFPNTVLEIAVSSYFPNVNPPSLDPFSNACLDPNINGPSGIPAVYQNTFSIVNFYERRARRILPALFFVMLVCVPFAWLWLIPSDLKDFGQSLVAVSTFSSNILFWSESGYFDTNTELKPLLHTWSLAVEEQYYVLFPIFIILAWRFGKRRVFWMIVLMAAVSLLLSEWGWRNKAAANFYLAPTRAWELFAGSISAFIVQKQGVKKNNLLALLGLAAIIFSIFVYDEITPFPSLYALVPVIGVVLIVLYADKETLVAKLLSTKVLVGIGLISYSAYLWHQPLFAFARIKLIEKPSMELMLILSITSITPTELII